MVFIETDLTVLLGDEAGLLVVINDEKVGGVFEGATTHVELPLPGVVPRWGRGYQYASRRGTSRKTLASRKRQKRQLTNSTGLMESMVHSPSAYSGW